MPLVPIRPRVVTVVDGIDRAPQAFLDLLEGTRLGRMLVRVGPEP